MSRLSQKTIAFFLPTIGRPGGAERVVATLANHMTHYYKKVLVINLYECPNEYPLEGDIERILLNPNHHREGMVVRNFKAIFRLRRACRQKKIDCLISFMGESNIRAVLAAMYLDIKLILSVRNNPTAEYGKLLPIVKSLFRCADGMVFQTEEAKSQFPSMEGDSCVIPNPIDERFFAVVPSLGSGRIVSVGRIAEQKNNMLLLDAFAYAAQKDSCLTLHYYGEPVDSVGVSVLDRLMKRACELGIKDRVYYHGQADDVLAVYGGAEMFVLSSNYEGMPNALMEALASGVPSISTDCPCGGPRELIVQNVNGILVPVRDAQTMSTAICALAKDKDTRRKMSDSAKLIAAQYRAPEICSLWNDYIWEVLN